MRRITVAGARRRAGRLVASVARRLGAPPAVPATSTVTFPADHRAWSARRNHRLKADFPAWWRADLSARQPSDARLAVVVHAFYPELMPELLEQLEAVPIEFDLIVTNASGTRLELDTSRLPLLAGLTILDIGNHGRDILPLVSLVNSGVLDQYELLLKVHTKRSAWKADHSELRGSGDAWRKEFLSSLLGSQDNVREILGAFASDPTLGTVTADGNVLGSDFWGGDEEIVTHLLKRLQLPPVGSELQFASGSMYWIRGFLIQGLRGLDLGPDDFEAEAGQIDGTTAHAVERLIGIVSVEAGYSTRERSTATTEQIHGDAWEHFGAKAHRRRRARVIPFYLPQFHQFDENDSWWGTGFTEWSNVAAGVPIYRGHNQPLLPADLGFYDLVSDDVRENQFNLADGAGLEGFMYYYYWFAGKKLMNRPIESLLASDSSTRFCIMWANENFTRRWDGSEENILIGQDYERAPAEQFISDVMPLLTDARYIRIHDRPVLAVYRITQIPGYRRVLDHWQNAAREAGLPGLHLVTVDVGGVMQGIEGAPGDFGLDATLGFAPHNMKWSAQDHTDLDVDARFHGNIMNYGDMAADAELRLLEEVEPWLYPGVMVNFDNTARRQWMPDIWYGSNPYTYRRWLDSSVAAIAGRDFDQRVVFINAWNEWAESAVLEPSQRWGKTFLLATRDVLFR